jgi:acyl-coenzyme A thioesterase PaaI-like protein
MGGLMPLVVNKDSRCYVCGPDNLPGLRAPFSQNGEQGSRARYTALAERAGWSGILHGGVTFAPMDEALGWPLYYRSFPAVTARVETRFHKPISVGAGLIVTGWVVKRRRRLFAAPAGTHIYGSEATLLAEASATMCPIWREGRSSDRFVYQEDSKNVSI